MVEFYFFITLIIRPLERLRHKNKRKINEDMVDNVIESKKKMNGKRVNKR